MGENSKDSGTLSEFWNECMGFLETAQKLKDEGDEVLSTLSVIKKEIAAHRAASDANKIQSTAGGVGSGVLTAVSCVLIPVATGPVGIGLLIGSAVVNAGAVGIHSYAASIAITNIEECDKAMRDI